MLELELKNHFPSIEIIGKYQLPEEAISSINKNEPDILFVDIEMPKLSGFDILRKVDCESQIIFTTAYSQYAIDAIKANAIDYLLKPLDTEELIAAVNKAIENIKQKKNTQIEEILKKLDHIQSDILKIPTSSGYAFIKKTDIIYLQSESNYTHVITTDKTHLVSKTMKSIHATLPEDDFIRIHNSFVVNIFHIKEYSRKDGGFVVLSNDKTLKVSNSKKDIFNE